MKIELEKSEIIFLSNILENLADELYEDDLMDKEENQKKIEYIGKIYTKLNEKISGDVIMERSLYDQELYERKLIRELKEILHEIKENRKWRETISEVIDLLEGE